jgi:hypothetical protein
MRGAKGLSAAVLAVCLCMSAASAQSDDRWKNIQFLIGGWAETGYGATGTSDGAEPQKHDDLLIVYADEPGMPVHGFTSTRRATLSDTNVKLAYRLAETNLTGKFEIAEDANAGYKTLSGMDAGQKMRLSILVWQ